LSDILVLYFQRSQVTELVQQSSGSSVLNEAAISNWMQAADSVDTGLVIMNVTGARKLLSPGSSTVVNRDIIEEIQRSSPEKKFIHYASKQSDQSSSESVMSLSCCGESQSRSHCAVVSVLSLLVRVVEGKALVIICHIVFLHHNIFL